MRFGYDSIGELADFFKRAGERIASDRSDTDDGDVYLTLKGLMPNDSVVQRAYIRAAEQTVSFYGGSDDVCEDDFYAKFVDFLSEECARSGVPSVKIEEFVTQLRNSVED